MQEIITNKQKPKIGFKISELSLEEKSRFIGAFVWLVEEDKKQNPANYQYMNSKND